MDVLVRGNVAYPSIKLSVLQYYEGLLDQKVFIKWTMDFYKAANFDQVGHALFNV